MKLFRRKKFEAEMDDELRFHLDAYIDDLVRLGTELKEAQRRARAEFGAIEARRTNAAKLGHAVAR
jgi:macrolide transport system ATP-binding/permease protein